MKVFSNLMLTAALAGAAAVASAQTTLYTTGFETDQSANFGVATSSADAEALFNYNYSTWTPSGTTAGITSIPTAPSAAGTTALRMRSNFDATATAEGISAYLTAAAADLANKTVYTITFDAFQMYNGPGAPAGTGTTTAMSFGVGAPGAAAYHTSATYNGFFIMINSEGGAGASGDARYYTGTGSAAVAVSNATPNWFNNAAADINMDTSTNWQGLFANPTYSFAGTPGRAWVTWRIERNGSQFTISVKPQGASSFTQVSTFTATVPAGAVPNIGFFDPFDTSTAAEPDDNFVLIDNLTVTEPGPEPTRAEIWSVYN